MSTISPEKNFEELLDSILDHDLVKVKTLIRQGVDVNGYEDHAKLRPLHFAVQYDFLSAVEALIAAGADTTAQTSDGETPLDIAKLYKNKVMIALLEKSYTNPPK